MRLALIVVVGCGSTAQTPVEPVVDPRHDAAVAVDAAPITVDAPTPVDAPPPPAPLALDTKPPALTGKVTKLAVKTSATIGGVTVKFASNGHKHPAGRGRTLGMWRFEVSRGAKKDDFELRDDEEDFEAEVDVLGVAMVFRHVDYSTFEIVLVAAKAPKPLTDDACAELVNAAAAKRGLPDESDGYSMDNGIVVARAPRWRGHCGTLTRRIWFTELPPREE
jgi:hypothetical protein